jgi:hypothetical protein
MTADLTDDDLRAEIVFHQQWMKKCGGDLNGYIAHYQTNRIDPGRPEEGQSGEAEREAANIPKAAIKAAVRCRQHS